MALYIINLRKRLKSELKTVVDVSNLVFEGDEGEVLLPHQLDLVRVQPLFVQEPLQVVEADVLGQVLDLHLEDLRGEQILLDVGVEVGAAASFSLFSFINAFCCRFVVLVILLWRSRLDVGLLVQDGGVWRSHVRHSGLRDGLKQGITIWFVFVSPPPFSHVHIPLHFNLITITPQKSSSSSSYKACYIIYVVIYTKHRIPHCTHLIY